MKQFKYTLMLGITLAAFSCSSDNLVDQDENEYIEQTELSTRDRDIKTNPCDDILDQNFNIDGNDFDQFNNDVATYLNTLFNKNDDGSFTIHPCLDEMLGPLSPNRNCDDLEVIATTGIPSGDGTFYQFSWDADFGYTYDGSFFEQASPFGGLTGKELMFYLSQVFYHTDWINGPWGASAVYEAEWYADECSGGNVVVTGINFYQPFPNTRVKVEIEYSCCRNFIPPNIGQDTI